MTTSPLPYEPPSVVNAVENRRLRVYSLVIRLLVVLSVLATIYIWVFQPDIEGFLYRNAAGGTFPDIFADLNRMIPVFMICLTVTLVLLMWIDILRRPILALPALAGPVMAVVGWMMTSNWQDLNWYHLVALTTIGLFVSSVVTLLLTLIVVATNVLEGRQQR